MPVALATAAPIPSSSSIIATSNTSSREEVPSVKELKDGGLETSSMSSKPIVSLDCDSISDNVAASLAISLIGHVLFLKSQVPLPLVQLSRLSNTKSSGKALKQRSELLSSFDTLTSHLNTTFTALSSAFARMRSAAKDQEDQTNVDYKPGHARAYLGIFVGSSTASAKAKVIFAVDGLEVKAIGARDDVVEKSEGPGGGDKGSTHDESDEEQAEDDSDQEGSSEDDDEESDDDDAEEVEDEDDEDEGVETDEDGSNSSPPESRSPSPEPSYLSHAEQQRALKAAERLLSRTLAGADAEGDGMSADLAPTQTHILLRAPRRFVHPAWIPRQNISMTLESTLDEFLEESGIRSVDPHAGKPRKTQKKGNAVEGVWVVGRDGLDRALGKDTACAGGDEWDEMIWWSWDGKIVGFSDW